MPKDFTPLRSISSASRISSIQTISLKEIYDNEEVGDFYVGGEIVSVQTTGEWYFIACKGKSCGRKLQPSKGLMHCKSCGKSWQEDITKYRITLTIMYDEEQDAPFLLWDRESKISRG